MRANPKRTVGGDRLLQIQLQNPMKKVSQWCYKSGPLKVIGQFSHDVIGSKTRVKFVNQSFVRRQ